jgi:hypothetical protein
MARFACGRVESPVGSNDRVTPVTYAHVEQQVGDSIRYYQGSEIEGSVKIIIQISRYLNNPQNKVKLGRTKNKEQRTTCAYRITLDE